MSGDAPTSRQLAAFREAAQSLKLYRRAELSGSDDRCSLIEKLYVDPLPEEQIFRTVLKPNTTFLIGRKGTGKSTIFQRLQCELLKDKTKTSAYVDIKTIYESSQIDPTLSQKLASSEISLSEGALAKLLLYRSFLRAVIDEIKSELKQRAEASFWERIKSTFSGNLDEIFEDLDHLLEAADDRRFISVVGLKKVEAKQDSNTSSKQVTGSSGSVSFSQNPSMSASAHRSSENQAMSGEEIRYADILMSTFNIKEFLRNLNSLLSRLGVRHLYVLVDDFSELPEDAMRIVVDTLLAPLNNWSDEFVKFKVAAYPGRIYYGQIDKTKIDEIYLDLYKLYGQTDVNTMEEKAADFTRRLVDRRLHNYGAGRMEIYLESDPEDVWQALFYATMANPRILGYILHFLHESQLIYGRKISVRSVQESARRYYEEKIESYFSINKFLHESFSERSSIFSLKELMEDIVQRARELRSHDSAVMKQIKGRPPTSHFHVVLEYETLLRTLELNFFITKYYEMSDRDGRKVSIYALNYGLCQKYTISFGRPTGKREFRLYFVERIFDYTSIMKHYMEKNQEIVCGTCGTTYGLENLEALKFYNMKCRNCGGFCEVINLSKRYENVLRTVNDELLLPQTELGILHTLHHESKAMFAADIAAELDCSYQLVGKRGKILDERGLVSRKENHSGRRVFEITDTAEASYFTRSDTDELDLGESQDAAGANP